VVVFLYKYKRAYFFYYIEEIYFIMNRHLGKRFLIAMTLMVLALSYTYGATREVDTEGFIVRSSHFLPSNDVNVNDAEIKGQIQSFDDQLSLVSTKNIDVANISEQRVLMAISSGEYPITPGDSFSLIFSDGANDKNYPLQVESNYEVVIPSVGNINAKGMDLETFTKEINKLILTYYLYANPQLVLMSTGQFNVKVVSTIGGTKYVPSWGLTRLSDVVTGVSPYTNSRDIEVVKKDNSIHHYDLFDALRHGTKDEDPYLESGDTVKLSKAQTLVVLSGSVFAPGTYQLKDGETIADLINVYGGGLIPGANDQAVRIERYNESTSSYDLIMCQSHDDIALQNLDKVVITNVMQDYGTVSISGAISVTGQSTDSNATATILGTSSGQVLYGLYPGDTVRDMLDSLSSRILSSADLTHCYLVRGGQKINLDIVKLMSGQDKTDNLTVQDGDQFFIPFNNKFVSVIGAVSKGGTFSYIPGRSASYYINLAGGKTETATGKVLILDSYGNTLDDTQLVPAEATIKVVKSTFVRNLSITASIIALTSALVTIVYNVSLIN